jgi:hypothetical protein
MPLAPGFLVRSPLLTVLVPRLLVMPRHLLATGLVAALIRLKARRCCGLRHRLGRDAGLQHLLDGLDRGEIGSSGRDDVGTAVHGLGPGLIGSSFDRCRLRLRRPATAPARWCSGRQGVG